MEPKRMEPCKMERTFENEEIVLSSQLESFTLSFDRGGGTCRVATVLKEGLYSISTHQKTGHTGTEYKTFGFGLSAGQFSRISRREDDLMPFPSVSTSNGPQASGSRST